MPVYYHKKDSLFSKTLKLIKFIAYGIYVVRKHKNGVESYLNSRWHIPTQDMLSRDEYFGCCKRVIEVRDRPHPQFSSLRIVFITFSKGHQVSVRFNRDNLRKYMPMRFSDVTYVLSRIVVPYVPYGKHEKWWEVTGQWATDIEFVLLVLRTLIKWGYI